MRKPGSSNPIVLVGPRRGSRLQSRVFPASMWIASPSVAKPSRRDRSRPSSGMAPRARARLSHPGSGIRRSRSGDLAPPARDEGRSPRVRTSSSLCDPRTDNARRRRAQVRELSSCANGTAVSSASWSLTRGMLPGMAAFTAASRRRPRRCGHELERAPLLRLKGVRNGISRRKEIAAPTSNAALGTGVSHPRQAKPSRRSDDEARRAQNRPSLRRLHTRLNRFRSRAGLQLPRQSARGF